MIETKMQTSFIPKKPVVESRGGGAGVSLFLLLSIIVFIVSIALSAGVFMWKKSLVSQIEKNKEALVAARASYEEGTIDALIRLDDRIKQSNILLSKHLAISPVFILLEKNVLKNVRLKSMKFAYGADDKIRVDLSGTATSYEVLSKQSEAFGSETLRPYISTPVVTDFSPTTDGNVSFNFNTLVNAKLISYTETTKAEATTTQ